MGERPNDPRISGGPRRGAARSNCIAKRTWVLLAGTSQTTEDGEHQGLKGRNQGLRGLWPNGPAQAAGQPQDRQGRPGHHTVVPAVGRAIAAARQLHAVVRPPWCGSTRQRNWGAACPGEGAVKDVGAASAGIRAREGRRRGQRRAHWEPSHTNSPQQSLSFLQLWVSLAQGSEEPRHPVTAGTAPVQRSGIRRVRRNTRRMLASF